MRTQRAQPIAHVISVSIAVALLIGAQATAASAEEETAGDPADALASITQSSESPATDVLANVADVETNADSDSGAAISEQVGDVTVEVPVDPSRPISMSADNTSFEVSLPFASSADDAEAVVDGVVSFDNNNGSSTAPVVKSDGSVQITTVIDRADAPQRYDYGLTIPAGGSASLGSDGTVTILSSDGSFFAGVSAAWAVDAANVAVPTHYELNGATLTQIVDLSGESIAYPVVADPWIGIDLINRTYWTNSNKTLSVDPTWWGRYGAGVAARWAGWAEVQTKTPGTRENTSSMQDQFFCHFDFVRLRSPNKPTWNLDLGRPNVSYATMVAKQCNP